MTKQADITITLTFEEAAILFCSTPMTPAITNRAHLRHLRLHDKACAKLANAINGDSDIAARQFAKVFYKP